MEGESGEQVSGLQKRNVVADPGRQSSLIALHPVFQRDLPSSRQRILHALMGIRQLIVHI